ncbi:MAG: hypothetical protein RL065_658 [Bacteroidota bacterium]|jgi:hypothetical protein
MLIRILAILVGIIAGFIVITFGDLILHQFINIPDGFNQNDKKALEGFIAIIPLQYLIIMVTYWLLSSFLGGLMASLVNRDGWRNSSLIVGVILMIGAIANITIIQHPKWMLIVSVIGYLPFAFLGGKIISMIIKPKN